MIQKIIRTGFPAVFLLSFGVQVCANSLQAPAMNVTIIPSKPEPNPIAILDEDDGQKSRATQCPDIKTIRKASITEINCDDPAKQCQSKGFFTNDDSIWYASIWFGKGVFSSVPDFHKVTEHLQKLSLNIDRKPMVTNEVFYMCRYAGDGLVVAVSNNEQILKQ